MDEVLIKYNNLKQELNKYKKIIYKIETDLIDMEKELADFDNIKVLDKLVLNEQQKEIVESEEKNMLVIACPGSGKTHTLISKYIYLTVKKNVCPDNIILITFTNKAGKEMSERINNLIPNKKPYHVGSLHGLSYRLLQKYNNINYTILDESDSKTLIKLAAESIFKVSELTDEEERLLKSQIVYIYEKISTNYPINITKGLNILNINKKYKSVIQKILKEYKIMKCEQKLLDFNDLMIMLCDLLSKNKLDDFINKIEYIFFDEYQDINPIQNYILSKFNNKCNLMVVGDDAQAIYSFRGSNVNYIWDFEKKFGNETKVKKYYLETNYRSTKRIVNLFQDIIKHNTKQFDKNVITHQNEKGLKPQIMSYPNQREQNKFIVDHIIRKYNDGVSLNDMVILARTNKSLNDIEMELLKYKIPITKSIGSNLLGKSHIKDFIAFLIIITNEKSLLHWKRILALHNNIGVQKANYIIENNDDVKKSVEELIESSEFYNKNLSEFSLLLKNMESKTLHQKIYLIRLYLEIIYKNNGDYNFEKKITEIETLIDYFSETSIEDFIGNIYLDQYDNCNMEDVLFLSTVHGAKGLEWDHVYLIDVTNNNFPFIRQSFYKNEMDNCEEERRLFYVACSRAKKELIITYYENIQQSDNFTICLSPFIRELSEKKYHGHNMNIYNFNFTGKISEDVKNFLRFKGYSHLVNDINNLKHSRNNIHKYCTSELPIPLDLKKMYIIGNFMDYLIAKIIQINFPNKVVNFDLNLLHLYPKFPKKLANNYKDKLVDWRDILEDIFYISTYKYNNKNILEHYKQILINDNTKKFYLNLETSIINFIQKIKAKRIQCHYNISCSPLKGECDILIDNNLFELKVCYDEACTFPNLCQVLLYGYLLEKKDIRINSVYIYNIYNGIIDKFDTSSFNFNNFKKLIYRQ